jgi:hypothetical protein
MTTRQLPSALDKLLSTDRGNRWFCSATTPSSTDIVIGDMWLRSTDAMVLQWQGSAWAEIVSIKGSDGASASTGNTVLVSDHGATAVDVTAITIAGPLLADVNASAHTAQISLTADSVGALMFDDESRPSFVSLVDSASGESSYAARRDHVHAIQAEQPVDIGSANAEGTATSVARSDHVHKGLTKVEATIDLHVTNTLTTGQVGLAYALTSGTVMHELDENQLLGCNPVGTAVELQGGTYGHCRVDMNSSGPLIRVAVIGPISSGTYSTNFWTVK